MGASQTTEQAVESVEEEVKSQLLKDYLQEELVFEESRKGPHDIEKLTAAMVRAGIITPEEATHINSLTPGVRFQLTGDRISAPFRAAEKAEKLAVQVIIDCYFTGVFDPLFWPDADLSKGNIKSILEPLVPPVPEKKRTLLNEMWTALNILMKIRNTFKESIIVSDDMKTLKEEVASISVASRRERTKQVSRLVGPWAKDRSSKILGDLSATESFKGGLIFRDLVFRYVI